MKPEKILEIINKMEFFNAEERRFFEGLRDVEDKTLRAYPFHAQTLEILRREAEKEQKEQNGGTLTETAAKLRTGGTKQK